MLMWSILFLYRKGKVSAIIGETWATVQSSLVKKGRIYNTVKKCYTPLQALNSLYFKPEKISVHK